MVCLPQTLVTLSLMLYEGICWKKGDPLMLTDGEVWLANPPKAMPGMMSYGALALGNSSGVLMPVVALDRLLGGATMLVTNTPWPNVKSLIIVGVMVLVNDST